MRQAIWSGFEEDRCHNNDVNKASLVETIIEIKSETMWESTQSLAFYVPGY